MAKTKKEDLKYEIKEVIGTLSQDVDIHSEWCKSILKTLMNDTQDGIDVRNYNATKHIMGTGIRMSIPEANRLVDLLLQNGYGSMEILESEFKKRQSLYQ